MNKLVFEYAKKKHGGQFRKNGIDPYIVHPFRVANLVEVYDGSEAQINAALLHDVVEDTNTTFEDLRKDLSAIIIGDIVLVEQIIKYVDALTAKFTKQDYPNLNREQRKRLEIKQFSKVADKAVKFIKLADIIDNLSSIEHLSTEFAIPYVMEDFRIIHAIRIEEAIYDLAVDTCSEAVKKVLRR